MKPFLIKGSRLIDPSQDLDTVGDLLIEDGKIKAVGNNLNFPYAEVIDGRGLILCPSFVDVHVHFRDPGQTYKEDIESGSKCAVAGGFTTVVCMPNTQPAIDSPEVAQYVIQRAREVGLCEVLPAGALTKGRQGKELTDFFALKNAGCVALTDDGSPLMDSRLMEKALRLARQLGLLVMNHCEDDGLARGHINEGYVSSLLGIAHRSPSAEDVLVARDCILSYHTKGRIHIQHISSKLSVEIIRFFKEKSAPVSCEVNPYHLLFEDYRLYSHRPRTTRQKGKRFIGKCYAWYDWFADCTTYGFRVGKKGDNKPKKNGGTAFYKPCKVFGIGKRHKGRCPC